MNPDQLINYLIRPALDGMGPNYSQPGAGVLLLSTLAQESHCGQYLHQVSGPALGIYQIEPGTHDLVWNWARECVPVQVPHEQPADDRLIWDLRYATVIARLLYASWGDPPPEPTVHACWSDYKPKYNSHLGAATFEQFERNWRQYVQPVLDAV